MNDAREKFLASDGDPLDDRLAAAIEGLDAELAPERDLWPAVRAEVRRSQSRRRARFALAAAAGILLAAVAGWWLRGVAEPVSPEVAETLAPADSRRIATGVRLAAYSEPDRALTAIRDQLALEIESRKDRLPPETRELVFENLRTIDRALAEIEAALEREPGNAELGRTYIAYRERQIGLLRQANRVASRL